MTDLDPELIAKATSAVRHERAYIAAAAFGVPLEDVGECAGMIAHAVLSAVADDLRAEGAAQALEETADRLDLTGLERNSELSRWDYDSSSDFYEELVTEWLDARAAKLRGADHD